MQTHLVTLKSGNCGITPNGKLIYFAFWSKTLPIIQQHIGKKAYIQLLPAPENCAYDVVNNYLLLD